MDAFSQIARRRRQLLVHRYIYYVCGDSLISDHQYDVWERELKALVAANPEDAERAPYAEECPTKCVGSSNIWDYPRGLQLVAESLLAWVEKYPFGYTPEADEELLVSEPQPSLF